MVQNMLIQDHKQAVMGLLQEGKTLLQSIGEEESAQIAERILNETRAKESPVIMFYGLYNAGKSTLINALSQANVAEVGDIPTTASIQRIPWEGYTLTDTPGIDAHAAHTEIAKNEILSSDVILFVMDNADTFDNALVYQTILQILDMGKPLAVVINQKHVDGDDDRKLPVPMRASIKNIMGKVTLNLEVQGRNNGSGLVANRQNFLGIFPVNAQNAFDAKDSPKEVRELLLDLSGINELKTALENSLRRSQQVYVLQTPLIKLREIFTQAIHTFQNAAIYGENQQMAENREKLLASRQRLRDRLLTEGQLRIDAVIEEVKTAAGNGQAVENVSEKLSQSLNSLLQEAARQENTVLRSELHMESMPGYRPGTDVDPVTAAPEDTTDDSKTWMAASAAALTRIPPIVVGPIPIPLNVIIAIATAFTGFLAALQSQERREQQRALQEVAESQEKLANYYRWLNELQTQTVKIKADYEKRVNDFLEQSYDYKLAELDRILADIDEGCMQHTQKLKELEHFRTRLGDEIVSLCC